MLNKKLLKLGLIYVASSVITTACLVGCTNPGYTSVQDTDTHILNDYILTDENVELVNNIVENIDVAKEEISTEWEKEANEGVEVTPDSTTPEQEEPTADLSETMTKVTVVRVVDGDTYVVNLDGQEVKVRLIGVDTPESVASQEYLDKTGKENTDFGKSVSDYMKGALTEGTVLYLEFDVNKYDKYNRVLAYAYFEDGEMIQEHLLKKGFAKVMTIEPNVAHSDRFVELERKAMEEGVGLWEGYDQLFENDEVER